MKKREMFEARRAPDGRALLNLGCGARFHRDWVNVDSFAADPSVISHDLLQGIPFESETFDVVYHSHFIEHIGVREARSVMRECHRVLKPGGMIRVVAPDMEYNAKLYLESLAEAARGGSAEAQERYEWAALNLFEQMVRDEPGGQLRDFLARPKMLDLDFIISTTGGQEAIDLRRHHMNPENTPRQKGSAPMSARRIAAALRYRLGRARALINGKEFDEAYRRGRFASSGELHKWAYDRVSMRELLAGLGFSRIEFRRIDESAIPGWASFHLDVSPEGAVYKPNSLVAEAVKP